METQQRQSFALNYVVNLLSRREYSEFELRCKLQEKAYSENEIEYAIGKCQERHWQSDQRFTENYLRARSQRGYGLKRIHQELTQLKGVQESTISEVLMEMEEENAINWQAIALNVLRKKFPFFQESLTPKQKQKIWQYMFSHGFNTDEFSVFIGMSDEEISDYFSEW